jgi:hypothetical protein
MKQRLIVSGIAVAVLSGIVVLAAPVSAASPTCSQSDILCYQPAAETLIEKLLSVNEPSIAVPDWLGGP